MPKSDTYYIEVLGKALDAFVEAGKPALSLRDPAEATHCFCLVERVAAISISGPTTRFDRCRGERARELLDAIAPIRTEMGYTSGR